MRISDWSSDVCSSDLGCAGYAMTMAARKAGTHSPLWLQGGYRLLFGAGALWAVVVVILWVGARDGRWTLPTAMTPLAWHQHELLFGYLGAWNEEQKGVVMGKRWSVGLVFGGGGAE